MRPAAALIAGLALVLPAAAHDGVVHSSGQEAAAHASPPIPFPIDIRVRFDLIDHHGRAVTEADFTGRPMLLFFGYASCEAICSTALSRMGDALHLLGEAADQLVPVMITVDPARDTPEALAKALPNYHERLLGLTGDDTALAEARENFQVEANRISVTADGPIFAHGSFIYLIDQAGRVQAVLPPILGADRIATLAAEKLGLLARPAPG